MLGEFGVPQELDPHFFRGKKVAIFGLSANPPTGKSGHQGIIQHLIKMAQFDEIWVLPVYVHMFFAKRGLEELEHRLRMCQLSFERLSNPSCKVRVLSIEKHVTLLHQARATEPVRIGTIDVVRFIKQQYPGIRLHFVLGTDTFNDLIEGKWKESKTLLDELFFEVIDRMNVDNTPKERESTTSTARFHNVPSLDGVSSTHIRALLSAEYEGNQATGVEQLLDPAVLRYIRDHKLYRLASSPHGQREKPSFTLTSLLLLCGVFFAILLYQYSSRLTG